MKKSLKLRKLEPMAGIEPATDGLRNRPLRERVQAFLDSARSNPAMAYSEFSFLDSSGGELEKSPRKAANVREKGV